MNRNRIFVFVVLLLVSVLLQSASDAFTPPPYQPPIDLSDKSFVELSAFLRSNSSRERESAAYCLADRLRDNAVMQRDFSRTFAVLKQRLAIEHTDGVIKIIWMSLSNMLRGKPGSAPARLFNEERQFFINTIATSQQRKAVKTSLFLVGYHKAPWGKAAVVGSLSFPDESVKIAAMKATIALQIREAQPPLLEILRNPDKGGSLHTKCVQTLGISGSTTALPELQRARNIRAGQGHSIADFDIAIERITAREVCFTDVKNNHYIDLKRNQVVEELNMKERSAPPFVVQVYGVNGQPVTNADVFVEINWIIGKKVFEVGGSMHDTDTHSQLKTDGAGKCVGYLRNPIGTDALLKEIKLTAIAWRADRCTCGFAEAKVGPQKLAIDPIRIVMTRPAEANIRVVDRQGRGIYPARIVAHKVEQLYNLGYPIGYHAGWEVEHLGNGRYRVGKLIPGVCPVSSWLKQKAEILRL